MGGLGQFALSQLSPDQQAALLQQTQPAQPAAQVQQPTTATAGYSSDVASPAAMPINSPNAPGSTPDLEARAAQAPQQLGQSLQNQAPSDYVETAPRPPNPFSALAQQYRDQLVADQNEARGGRIKNLLTGFLSGMGSSMMSSAGLETPAQKQQRLFSNATRLGQLADQHEQIVSELKSRAAQQAAVEQNTAFNAQMQPLRLQEAQQGVTQGQQAIQTVPTIYTAEHIKTLFPMMDDATVQQNAGHVLTAADQAALQQKEGLYERANGLEKLDYGQTGKGLNKGIWWINSITKQPQSQISPVSESGSARDLQKAQFAQQNAMLKASGQLVVAYDPAYPNPNGTRGGNVVMSQADAQQKNLQHYKADPSNLNATIGGFNDVQQKINMLAEVANDPSRMGQVQPGVAAAILEHGKGITFGAFGTSIDPSRVNEGLYAEDVRKANQATRDYVAAMGAAHEAMTQLPRLQTFGKSSRMTEQQMQAAQRMLPQPGDDAGMAQQKMVALQTTLDPLRRQLPHMQGADLLPTWQEGKAGNTVRQTTGAGGFNWNNYPVAAGPQ